MDDTITIRLPPGAMAALDMMLREHNERAAQPWSRADLVASLVLSVLEEDCAAHCGRIERGAVPLH